MKRLAPILLALALVALPSAGTAQTAPPVPYSNTFDNYVVSAPTALHSDQSLNTIVHSRDIPTWRSLEPMTADHGAGCEAPPATHQLTGSYDDAVFLCSANPHVMTALKASGYGVIYMRPGALADFSQGEVVIRWDVSTLRHSYRDWLDVWVTPFEDALAAPLQPSWPDLAGNPRRAVTVTMGVFTEQNGFKNTTFSASDIRNFTAAGVSGNWWEGYEKKITPSASRRDTFEMRLSKTHVKVSLLNATTKEPVLTWVDKDFATPLDWDRGIVQFGHHSYNPEKDCPAGTTAGQPGCMAGTFHWDQFWISKTAPLTQIPSVERWANATSPRYTFAQPAPANAFLQIHAQARSVDLSLDNGATWQPMVQKSQTIRDGRTTFTAFVPPGTTSVQLRGVAQSGYSFDVSHAVIQSVDQAPAPTATPPQATQTPTLTPTPVPPTNTPGPTSTPIPIPTATAVPACVYRVFRNDTLVAEWGC